MVRSFRTLGICGNKKTLFGDDFMILPLSMTKKNYNSYYKYPQKGTLTHFKRNLILCTVLRNCLNKRAKASLAEAWNLG